MGDGWASPLLSLSLFSKSIQSFVIWDIVMTTCDDVMLRPPHDNIPIDFFPKETRLDACGPAYRPQRGIEYNYVGRCVDAGCDARDALISTRDGRIIRSRQWCSHQHRPHPTGSLRSAINYSCDPYQYIPGLLKTCACMCNTTNLCCFQGCRRCLPINGLPDTVHSIFECISSIKNGKQCRGFHVHFTVFI